MSATNDGKAGTILQSVNYLKNNGTAISSYLGHLIIDPSSDIYIIRSSIYFGPIQKNILRGGSAIIEVQIGGERKANEMILWGPLYH